jgi:aminopeptidase N
MRASLLRHYRACAVRGPYRFNAQDAGLRALRNTCLRWLCQTDTDFAMDPEALDLALRQLKDSDNMTEQFAALICLAGSSDPRACQAVEDFGRCWSADPLVMDKWFSAQAAAPLPDALERVKRLMEHPVFDRRNPNRIYSLVGTFCRRNHVRFHDPSGAGYGLLTDMVLELDQSNPQVAARLLIPLTTWRQYEPQRRALMRQALEQIAAKAISPDVAEIVRRSLAAAQ